MYLYVFKRLTLMIPTLLGAAALVFFLMRLIPGDICTLRLATGGGSINPGVVKACRLELGMDQPILLQFWLFIKGLLSFDFGRSMWTGRPIVEEVALRFQLSLQVAIMATVTAVLIAIPLGTISAVKQNTWIDYLVRAFSIAGVAMPSFWLGILIILAILIVSKALFGSPWMPPIKYVPIWVDPVYNLSMLIWPALATGYRYSAVATRMTRSAMLEVLREDYVRTARAKGVFRSLIVRRHALRNASASGRHHHRHRVCLPDGRPGRHRAGLQSQRPRQAVRGIRLQPGLHHDAGAGDAGGDHLRLHQSHRRRHLCRGSTRASATAGEARGHGNRFRIQPARQQSKRRRVPRAGSCWGASVRRTPWAPAVGWWSW